MDSDAELKRRTQAAAAEGFQWNSWSHDKTEIAYTLELRGFEASFKQWSSKRENDVPLTAPYLTTMTATPLPPKAPLHSATNCQTGCCQSAPPTHNLSMLTTEDAQKKQPYYKVFPGTRTVGPRNTAVR